MVLIYTCNQCGLQTRVEQGQDYHACGCRVDYAITNEDGTPVTTDPAPIEPPP